MKLLLLIFSLILFASFSFAFPLISDGSFEENCGTSECIYTPSVSEPGTAVGGDWRVLADCANTNTKFRIIQDSNIATHGQYYGYLRVNNPPIAQCSFILVRNTQSFNGGVLYWDVNNHSSNVGGHFQIVYYYDVGGTTILYSQPSSSSIGLDKNVVLPNYPGRVALKITGGGSSADSIARFDNVRHQRYPVIEFVGKAFEDHITSGEEFYIQVNYSAGASCTVTETTSGTSYSAPYIGNEKYRTAPISYAVNSLTSRGVLKLFKVNCDGLENTDSRWKVRVNKDDIIFDGSFDENCSSCTYNLLGPGGKFIGDDWNASSDCTSTNQAYVNIETNYDTATDINSYAELRISNPPIPSCGRVQLKNQQLLNGGTIYWDVNGYVTTLDKNFQVIFDYNAGGSTTLYNKPVSQTVGFDHNVTLPNSYGKIVFRLLGDGASAQSAIFLDNIRYYSPKFSESTLCKKIIYRGDPDQKIDLVFISSGFSDQNQLESAVRFVLDENGGGNGLFSFEPFKTYKDKFNVWMIDEYNTYQLNGSGSFNNAEVNGRAKEVCPFGNEFSLLSINPRFGSYSLPPEIDFLKNVTSNGTHMNYVLLGCELGGLCPFPVDVNVSNPDCNGSGTSGCSNAADNIDELQRVFTHEFGHSFGGLWDEYWTGNTTTVPAGTLANCTESPVCSKWSTIPGTGCFSPCYFDNWYRAYDTNTVMGSHFNPRHEFGQVNVNELSTDIIFYPPTSPLIKVFYTFILSIMQKGGQMSVLNASLVPGIAGEFTLSNDANYIIQLKSDDENTLYDFNFSPPVGVLGSPLIDMNGLLLPEDYSFTNDRNFALAIPYFDGASFVKIVDRNQNIVLSYNVGHLLANIEYTIGNGSGVASNSNYITEYSVIQQPVGRLTSNNYICQLGGVLQHG